MVDGQNIDIETKPFVLAKQAADMIAKDPTSYRLPLASGDVIILDPLEDAESTAEVGCYAIRGATIAETGTPVQLRVERPSFRGRLQQLLGDGLWLEAHLEPVVPTPARPDLKLV